MANNQKSFSEQNGLVDKGNQTSQNTSTENSGVDKGIQEILRSLGDIREAIVQGMEGVSQSNARINSGKPDPDKVFRTRAEQKKEVKGPKNFWDGVTSEISKELLGTDYKKAFGSIAANFAKSLGTDLEHLPGKIGQLATKSLISSFKNTEMGKEASKKFEEMKGKAVGKVKDFVKSQFEQGAAASYERSGMSTEDAKKAASGLSGKIFNVKRDEKIPDKDESQEASRFSETKAFFDRSVEHYNKCASFFDGIDRELQGEVESDAIKDVAKSGLDTVAPEVRSAMESGIGDVAASGLSEVAAGGEALGEVGSLAEGAGGVGANAMASLSRGMSTIGPALAEMGVISGETATAMASLSGAVAVIGPALIAAAPYVLAAVAAIAAVTIASKLVEKEFNDMKEATKGWFDQLKTSTNRYAESRKKNLELANERLRQDVQSMIEQPFKLLEDAAQKAYDVWDSTLRTITATQGYSKSDYQDLLASYAERLRSEGLSSVISATDIAGNLEKVLGSGLSGAIAEEFAYLATELNAAIPTQDFFNYASSYAAIVANLVKSGKSQEAAMQEANSQLATFASSVLYAGRELSGGITTGLQDAQSLFESSIQIAQAARTGNASQIAGVLTSISAITGAIAPDIATSIVDAVVKAATGGNESSIVALRSLAGINASNTEFLRAFASDPQSVFATLFRNLDKYSKMSSDAYMEVAEGLAPIFGISQQAFSRLDFAYLADAVLGMKVDGSALDKNMKLLIQGETTTSAEMHRIQEVNKMLVEEGLSLVLDNEVARAIQQHMWDEQLARELMESTYGVELTGKTATMLESIRMFIEKIAKLLNPFKWLTESVANLVGTAVESAAQQEDIKNLLMLGQVGLGNTKSLYQLTTRNQDLNLTTSMLSRYGGISLYETAKGAREVYTAINRLTRLNVTPITAIGPASDLANSIQQGVSYLLGGSILNPLRGSTTMKGKSAYRWGMVSKSEAASSSTLAEILSSLFEDTGLTSNVSTFTSSQSQLSQKLSKMTDNAYISKLVGEGKSYRDWEASASRFGIADIDAAMTELGVSKSAIEEAFAAEQTRRGEEIQKELEQLEREFWEGSKIHFEEATVHYGKAATYFEATFVEYRTSFETYAQYVEDFFRRETEPFYFGASTCLTNIESFFKETTALFYNNTTDYLSKIVDALSGDTGMHSTLKTFWEAWENYYIKRLQEGYYLSSDEVASVQQKEKSGQNDIAYYLAESLSGRMKNLEDPAVQTNVLLSKLVLLVQALLDQGAMSGGGGSTLLDSMTALSLGLTRNVTTP